MNESLDQHVRRVLDATKPSAASRIHVIKSAVVEHAARVRDLAVTRQTSRLIVVDTPRGAIPFERMNGPRSSVVGKLLCDNKELTRPFLQEIGVPVPEHHVFGVDDLEGAQRWAAGIDGPVVLKPTNLSRGRGVFASLSTPQQLAAAWRKLRRMLNARRLRDHGPETAAKLLLGARGALRQRRTAPLRISRPDTPAVMLERHIPGHDYRAYVVGDRVASVVQRLPASVTGDGRSTIRALIDEKNRQRSSNLYLAGSLIPAGANALDALTQAGHSLDDRPARGAQIQLRHASNLATGGDSVDVMDLMHQGFAETAVAAVRAVPGIEYAGVDIIADDITRAPTSTNHVVSEVEYSPGPGAHWPLYGRSRDMGGALVEHYVRISKGGDRLRV